MKKRTIGILLVLALVAAMFAGCQQTPQQPAQGGWTVVEVEENGDDPAPAGAGGPVRIAVAAPLTGDNAEYGQGFLNAARLQAERRNAAGGVLGGRMVEIVPFDDANSAEEAASIALRIASDGDFAGVIGHFSSGVAMTAAPTYNENQIVNISPSAGHVDFSGIGEFIFRNNAIVVVEAGAILDIAVTDLGHTRIGILSIMTDWGYSTSRVIMNLVEGMPGVEVVAHEEVMEGSPDFSPAITAFEAAGAEVVISVSQYSTLGPFAIQYRTINPDIDILGFSNAYTRGLINIGGPSVEGVRFPVSFFADSPDPVIQTFVSDYMAANGYSPSALTAQAFDAVGILLDSIEAAGTTEGEPVRQQMHIVSHNGVAGVVTFDANGDVQRDFFRVVIRDGEFVLTN